MLSVCVFLTTPFSVRADDAATTTPEVSTARDEATSTDPVATSSDPAPMPIPAVPITLDIETQSGTLFNGAITVIACKSSPGATTETITAFCAIEQSGIPAVWSWYGSDAFIDSLGGVSNDYATSAYWNWFSDLAFGMTSLNTHELHAGESVLITIGRMPLRLSLSPNTLVAESTTTVSISEFGFDTNFNPVWTSAASSTVLANGAAHETDNTGVFTYVPVATGTVTLSATKEGYLPITPIVRNVAAAPAQENEPVSSTGGGHSSPLSSKDPAASARDFLLKTQHAEGSFGSPLLTDWVALALARSSNDLLKRQELSMNGSLLSATDFERHAMALEALGIDPSEIALAITAHFDGTQIGDPILVNDDIFGLIALSHAGYTGHDLIIKSVAAFVVKKQSDDGSWGNTDLNAAAIQALSPLTELPGVASAVSKARSYLASHEQANGCFGNSFTTSWSIMAITALGESPDAWKSSGGSSPIECLRTLQAADGGFEEGASPDTRIWATAYALPALEGRTWRDILGSYARPTASPTLVTSIELTPALPTATTTSDTLSTPSPAAPVPTKTAVRPLVTQKLVLAKHLPSTVLMAGVAASLEPLPAIYRPNFWSQVTAFVRTIFKTLHLT